MDRRDFLTMLTLPAAALVLQACGDDDPVARTGEQRSDQARARTQTGEATAAATALNDFGTTLYRRLATADPAINLVLSPASIAIALTMAAAGARGATLEQMLATLRIADPAVIHRSTNGLAASLDDRSHDGVTVELTNSLWGQDGLEFDPEFLGVLAVEYGTAMNTVDYEVDPEAARRAINDRVDTATHHRIGEVLPAGSITIDTVLALVNTIYLKAPWATPFIEDATTDAPFTLVDGAIVDVATMSVTTSMLFAAGDGWQAVELPYATGELAMLIFLPEDGFLGQFEEIFLVSDATQYLQPAQVELSLPRFDIESNVHLGDVLAAMGMPLAFSDGADFSGMTVADELKISKVVHHSSITVDETGTEAAAATGVALERVSAQPTGEPLAVVVDRPFVFAVRDRTTEAILFLGRVSDPRS